LLAASHKRAVKTCWIVTTRQWPETAKGTSFISLEDEAGEVQEIVHQAIGDCGRRLMLSVRQPAAEGRLCPTAMPSRPLAWYLPYPS